MNRTEIHRTVAFVLQYKQNGGILYHYTPTSDAATKAALYPSVLSIYVDNPTDSSS